MSKMQTPDFTAEPPRTFSVSADGGRLELVWQDGRRETIAAETLWSNCPSAAGRRRRLDGIVSSGDPSLALTGANPIGNYALNLAFSDGHDRGIYPWKYLADLAARPTVDAFLTPPVKDAKSADEYC